MYIWYLIRVHYCGFATLVLIGGKAVEKSHCVSSLIDAFLREAGLSAYRAHVPMRNRSPSNLEAVGERCDINTPPEAPRDAGPSYAPEHPTSSSALVKFCGRRGSCLSSIANEFASNTAARALSTMCTLKQCKFTL